MTRMDNYSAFLGLISLLVVHRLLVALVITTNKVIVDGYKVRQQGHY